MITTARPPHPQPIPDHWTEADIAAERARVERAVTAIVDRALAQAIVRLATEQTAKASQAA